MTSAVIKSIADHFNSHGFVLVKHVIPHELVDKTLRFLPSYIDEKYGLGYQSTHTDNPLSGCGQTISEQYFVPLAQMLKLSGVLDAILGPTSFLRIPPGCRAVHPNHPEGLGPAHQDGGRLHDMEEFVTAWIPFVEIDNECGGLGLYPSLGIPPGPIPEGTHGIDMGARVPKPVHMSPGDVLIFHKWLPHISMPNTSNRIRYSFDMRFYSSLKGGQKKQAIDLQKWRWVNPPNN